MVHLQALQPNPAIPDRPLPGIRRVKLAVPEPAPGAVPRPDLEARLERAADAPLTLVIAAAGYGKTTLLASWARATRRRVAWLSLDEGDADLRRFAAHLVAAIRAVSPGAAPSLDDLLGGERLPGPAALAEVLAEDLLDLPEDVTLVLDDLHAIPDPGPARLLDALLRRPLPTLRIVVGTRVEPEGMPAIRLRALGQVETIGERDLALGPAEIAAIVGPDGPPPQEIARRTDGWAAGVRALSLGGDRALPEGVRAYLELDVLAGQPAELVEALRGAAIAERVSPALLAAVSDGVDAPARAAALLGEVSRRGLFVTRLDDAGEWWRVHPLLRDVLLADLRARGGLGELRLRAARWFAAAGMAAEAADQALLCGDPAAAADLLEAAMLEWIASEGDSSRDWVDRLPLDLVGERPALLVARATVLMTRANLPGARAALARAEALLAERDPGGHRPETQVLHWEMVNIRGQAANVGGDPTASLDEQWELISGVSGANRRQRAVAPAAWGLGMALLGRGEEALDRLEPLAMAELDARDVLAAKFLLAVVGVHIRLADLAAAARWNALARDVADESGNLHVGTWSAVVEAMLAAEAGDHAAVEVAARAALPLAPGRFFLPKSQLSMLLARALLAQGRIDEARAAAAQDRRRIELAGALGLLPGVAALEAGIALAAGDREAAWRWADAARLEFGTDALRIVEHPAATQARIWLDRGGPGDARRAAAVLSALRDHEAATHHRFSEARTLPLLAAAQAAAGDGAAALATMREALAIEPGAMTRRFADAGPGALPLLEEIAADAADPLAHRAARMLAAVGPDAAPAPASPPPCPLTPRELEILGRMAEWKTNKEIGFELGITPVTVRDHGVNAFRKLGVGDRRTAVEVARAAGWI